MSNAQAESETGDIWFSILVHGVRFISIFAVIYGIYQRIYSVVRSAKEIVYSVNELYMLLSRAYGIRSVVRNKYRTNPYLNWFETRGCFYTIAF
jgi:hypothetical protein